ncbi:MAG: dihydroorotate dehydrogenase [Acidimicrobiia bacterium]
MRHRHFQVDGQVQVGPLTLPHPIVAASGTFGYGDEVARLCPPTELGALTVKSLLPDPWPGNPAPRVAPVTAGMMNAVGLPGPGIAAWIQDDLPVLVASGARIIGSIWGRSVTDYETAAKQIDAVRDSLIALEVNVSCPNVEARSEIFGHSCEATAAVVRAVRTATTLPLFVKLSPNVTSIVEIARVALDEGADGLTCVNTVIGLSIDPETRRPRLGKGGGGLSGPAIKPIAIRAVRDIRDAFPDVPIIGTGGVATGLDAVEMLLAGANAVGVGTATFQEPRATLRIRNELYAWCDAHNVVRVADLTGQMERP